jgi:glycosyltransferase involved in cell wall biosynthesis
MNILLTVHQFFPAYSAGTEVLTFSVARELIKRGHEVRILTAEPGDEKLQDDERFDQYHYEGIHIYRFYHAYTPMAGQHSMIEISFDNNLAANYFGQILKDFKPDLVHFFHLNRLGTGLIEKCINAGIPAFMTPTDFWLICPTGQLLLADGKLCSGANAYAGNCVKHFAQGTQKGLAGKIAKWIPTFIVDLLVIFTRANVIPAYPQQLEIKAISSRLSKNITRLNQLNKIVSPNAFMTEKLVQQGVLSQLIIQSAFGIDIQEEKSQHLRQSPHNPFRIGFIGTLAPYKGCHILIEAFNRLPENSAQLKIYGKTADFQTYSDEIMQLAQANKNIEFCGVFPNSKISEVLTELDALVIPSLWFENTPLVLYSAQAAHCPVIASDFPGISAVIEDQVNGLLFEAGNVPALTKQLRRLINEPELAKLLGNNSQQPKSIAVYVDELVDIWEKNT